MTVGEYKKQAERALSKANIGTAELDVLVLFEDLLNTNRAQLLAHPELELTVEQQKVLNSQIERRKNHEPLAYIRGKTEFYGREFFVNKNVLEPRPESEEMLNLLCKLSKTEDRRLEIGEKLIIVDVGTGSGALGITAKLEIPSAQVFAIDIDPACLVVAKRNARKHNVDIKFLQGNLLDPISNLRSPIFVPFAILANLPYVPDDYQINLAAGHEPKLAIFGGKDGLDLYRKLFAQLSSITYNLKPKTYVLTESLPAQHQELQKIAQKSGYKLERTEDFIQVFYKS